MRSKKMPELTITVDDPRTADVRAMLERHLAFANDTRKGRSGSS